MIAVISHSANRMPTKISRYVSQGVGFLTSPPPAGGALPLPPVPPVSGGGSVAGGIDACRKFSAASSALSYSLAASRGWILAFNSFALPRVKIFAFSVSGPTKQ